MSLTVGGFLTILLQVPEVTTNNGILSCDTGYDGACIGRLSRVVFCDHDDAGYDTGLITLAAFYTEDWPGRSFLKVTFVVSFKLWVLPRILLFGF